MTFTPFLDPSGMLGFLPWHHQKGRVFRVVKKHFTEEQIAFALQQAESGTSVADRSDTKARHQRYRPSTGGRSGQLASASLELRRFRILEEENRKLKQLVADLSLDKKMRQDVLSKKL
jgi:putative transposase